MTKQQESENMGIVFLVVLLLNIIVSVGGTFIAMKGVKVGIWGSVLCEAALLIPVLVYVFKSGQSFTEAMGLHKIKISTVLLTIVLNIVITPIWVFANFFSQLFVPNTVAQSANSMLSGSAGFAILVVSLLPPFIEEFAFRGLLFGTYKRVSTIVKAALISALFFGLIHLNFNQFCYAFVLGVIFAFVNVASGSIITSMIMHFLINSFNMLLVYAAMLAANTMGQDLSAVAESQRQSMLVPTIVFFFLAIAFAFVAKIVMRGIARNEGNLEEFDSIFKKNGSEQADSAPVFTLPAIIATVIGVAGVIGFSYMMMMMN
ncbi:CPBP family intramembrane glutamic endopeptidase [Butyrivibrio sp. AD3002]|uniref:CPBP family intramembrane glutamic endopeptidase n=1 Tax=Butyrivibrio sp. AD3002 TaxID=1280670 RepID=UPI0003B39D47|nr:type II CAAX endopeptidase family protein [Butyrivibrio sp. AD3002]